MTVCLALGDDALPYLDALRHVPESHRLGIGQHDRVRAMGRRLGGADVCRTRGAAGCGPRGGSKSHGSLFIDVTGTEPDGTPFRRERRDYEGRHYYWLHAVALGCLPITGQLLLGASG